MYMVFLLNHIAKFYILVFSEPQYIYVDGSILHVAIYDLSLITDTLYLV